MSSMNQYERTLVDRLERFNVAQEKVASDQLDFILCKRGDDVFGFPAIHCDRAASSPLTLLGGQENYIGITQYNGRMFAVVDPFTGNAPSSALQRLLFVSVPCKEEAKPEVIAWVVDQVVGLHYTQQADFVLNDAVGPILGVADGKYDIVNIEYYANLWQL